MTRHRIYITDNAPDTVRLSRRAIRRSVRKTLRAQGVTVRCEISVLITDDDGIRALNREHRHIDAATDVLSFPLCEFTPGDFRAEDGGRDASSGLLPLGDIVLSAERVKDQAEEYGQTAERECAYLVVHSVLHLLGYDHVDEGAQKREMRAREKAILASMGFYDE
jgi:probable rRNA maturation factor